MSLQSEKGKKTGKKYALGWLTCPEPSEDITDVSNHTWSSIHYGLKTRTLYKYLKEKDQWFRFAFLVPE